MARGGEKAGESDRMRKELTHSIFRALNVHATAAAVTGPGPSVAPLRRASPRKSAHPTSAPCTRGGGSRSGDVAPEAVTVAARAVAWLHTPGQTSAQLSSFSARLFKLASPVQPSPRTSLAAHTGLYTSCDASAEKLHPVHAL